MNIQKFYVADVVRLEMLHVEFIIILWHSPSKIRVAHNITHVVMRKNRNLLSIISGLKKFTKSYKYIYYEGLSWATTK